MQFKRRKCKVLQYEGGCRLHCAYVSYYSFASEHASLHATNSDFSCTIIDILQHGMKCETVYICMFKFVSLKHYIKVTFQSTRLEPLEEAGIHAHINVMYMPFQLTLCCNVCVRLVVPL